MSSKTIDGNPPNQVSAAPYAGNFLPSIDAIYSIGSLTIRWLNFYIRNIYAYTLSVGTLTPLTVSVNGVLTSDNATDVTGTSAAITTSGGIYAAKKISGNKSFISSTTALSLQNGIPFAGSNSYHSIGNSQAMIAGTYTYTNSDHSSQLVLLDNSSTSGDGGNCGAIAFAGPAKNFGTQYYMSSCRIRGINTALSYGGTIYIETLNGSGQLTPAIVCQSSQRVGINTTTIPQTLTVNGTLSSSGQTDIATSTGTTSIGSTSKMTVTTAGVTSVQNTTDATATGTGALICSGGGSFAKILYAQGIMNVNTYQSINQAGERTFTVGSDFIPNYMIYRQGQGAGITDKFPDNTTISATYNGSFTIIYLNGSLTQSISISSVTPTWQFFKQGSATPVTTVTLAIGDVAYFTFFAATSICVVK